MVKSDAYSVTFLQEQLLNLDFGIHMEPHQYGSKDNLVDHQTDHCDVVPVIILPYITCNVTIIIISRMAIHYSKLESDSIVLCKI